MPERTTNAIYTVTRDILSTSAHREKLEALGLTVSTEPPAVFAERIRRETALWADVISSRKIKMQ